MRSRISYYRPTGQSRRQARQTTDLDVFEGLPVRPWTYTLTWITPPPNPSTATAHPGATLAPALPLPRDAERLTPMSLALLSAARAGTLDQPVEKDEGAKEEGKVERLFVCRKWVKAGSGGGAGGKDGEDGNAPVAAEEESYLCKTPGILRRKRRVRGKDGVVRDELVEVKKKVEVVEVVGEAGGRRVPRPPVRRGRTRGVKRGRPGGRGRRGVARGGAAVGAAAGGNGEQKAEGGEAAGAAVAPAVEGDKMQE